MQHEVRELKNQLRQARQEKNLLELKNELILDMVQILFIHELILNLFQLTLNSLELKRLKDTVDQQAPRLKQK